MSRRAQENDSTHYRSERQVAINGQWFFMTRESPTPKGPFKTRETMKSAMSVYVEAMKANCSQLEADARIRALEETYSADRF